MPKAAFHILIGIGVEPLEIGSCCLAKPDQNLHLKRDYQPSFEIAWIGGRSNSAGSLVPGRLRFTSRTAMRGRGPMKLTELLQNLLLTLASLMIAATGLEFALRIVEGKPLLDFHNRWKQSAHLLDVHTLNQYDPLLGWRLRDDIAQTGFNTGAYGIRKNGNQDLVLLPKQILAVGDSFTFGSDVSDDESWPAQLEELLGRPVYNAGVGGFATDQIVLAGERLMDAFEPEILLLGILEGDVE